jgi:hypothetical protein
MTIPLEKAVDMVVKGIFPDEDAESVNLGDHDFYLR